MQYFQKIQQKQRQVHLFGCNYSHSTRRQAFFNHRSPSPTANIDHNACKMEEENKRLKRELHEVRKILSTILYVSGEGEEEQKGVMELLEELLLMVLAKAEQNASLRQKLEQINVETVQKIESRLSLFESSKPQSAQSSHKDICTEMEQCRPNVAVDGQINEPSRGGEGREREGREGEGREGEGEGRGGYWPKVLFSIGKEVKTIGQISSNKLVKKESLHSYSKSSSPENSFKDLLQLKKSRLSIDKSIYVQTERDCDPRFSLQNSSRTIQSYEVLTKNNLGVGVGGNQLTPIKEERFSDKYSEIDCSKIKAAAVSFANGERFTFESTNTDPSSYNSKHC